MEQGAHSGAHAMSDDVVAAVTPQIDAPLTNTPPQPPAPLFTSGQSFLIGGGAGFALGVLLAALLNRETRSRVRKLLRFALSKETDHPPFEAFFQ